MKQTKTFNRFDCCDLNDGLCGFTVFFIAPLVSVTTEHQQDQKSHLKFDCVTLENFRITSNPLLALLISYKIV